MPSRKVEDLIPEIQPKAKELIELAKRAGIDILITSTFRTFQEQAELYSLGRTKPGKRVTNAKPGESFHNVRRAFDVVPIVLGKAVWDSGRWEEIGKLGESLGFGWGGRFTRLKDSPHFEWKQCDIHKTIHPKAEAFGEDGVCKLLT